MVNMSLSWFKRSTNAPADSEAKWSLSSALVSSVDRLSLNGLPSKVTDAMLKDQLQLV